MAGRTLWMLLGAWLMLRIVVVWLVAVLVGVPCVLVAMAVLGILGALEWWILGSKRCWDLADRISSAGQKQIGV